MDKEFMQFIIGSLVIVPILFLIIRVNRHFHKKYPHETYTAPRSMMDDPWDPNSDWNRHRRDDLPG